MYNIIQSILLTISEIPNKNQKLLNLANNVIEDIRYNSFRSMCDDSKIVHKKMMSRNNIALFILKHKKYILMKVK